ncbi:MAG: type IIA DNA topoisomerase subunit B [Deltaproteobacteria bacterium]|nr:type IIA DNA topoisomerase subunit B [Deltaproteobacteria bacterium]
MEDEVAKPVKKTGARNSYTARDIEVLEGIDAVRLRPGMYIGGTGADGLHHLVWEIVDNATDEAMNGHATLITVTLHKSGDTVSVEDNGRGIPVDLHPKAGKSALEVILTTLHAGGKFGDGNYDTAGGLHGVGSSAVNALSSKLEARVKRDGREWVQSYRKGRPTGPVEDAAPARGTGTKITFTPDPSIFEDTTFDAARILAHLEMKSFLHRGLRLLFRDQVSGTNHDLKHDGGLADWLDATLQRNQDVRSVDARFVLDKPDARLELALAWTEAPRERITTFVNGIPTSDGGTHEIGLRDALVKALRAFIDAHDLAPRGLTLTAEDLREGVLAILSLRLKDPQFQGQTKGRLNNPEVRSQVDGAVRPALEDWLHQNRTTGEAVVNRAAQAARARMASRQAEDQVRRKSATSGRLNLPGKLADCSSSDPDACELFIVEGDSAGGSAKQGRDRRTQAILPIRGKVLNTEQANLKKVLENEELTNVVTALGCGMAGEYRREKLRYGRVILLMDADSDGHHITTLMLTFFYRHLRQLIEDGRVFIAQPPLYRINAGHDTLWALDDRERDAYLARLSPRAKPEITRFKGLGEMPPKALFETTLDPARRRLLRVALPDADLAEATIGDLMGKDPSRRFSFIMDAAGEVENVDV